MAEHANIHVVYTARFFDSNGYEMEELTKSFGKFNEVTDYFNEAVKHNAIPFAQIDKNNQAISATTGRRIGSMDDSRKY